MVAESAKSTVGGTTDTAGCLHETAPPIRSPVKLLREIASLGASRVTNWRDDGCPDSLGRSVASSFKRLEESET
jgi:hypothetical protein